MLVKNLGKKDKGSLRRRYMLVKNLGKKERHRN